MEINIPLKHNTNCCGTFIQTEDPSDVFVAVVDVVAVVIDFVIVIVVKHTNLTLQHNWQYIQTCS